MPRNQTRIITCKRCERNRYFFAKEMCRSCYQYENEKDKRVFCSVCNRDNMKYGGKNICRSCMSTKSKMKDYEAYKKRHAQNEKNRRARTRDVYNERERQRNKNPKRIEYRKKNTLNWQRRNKDHLREYRKVYREREIEKVTAWDQNKRVRKMLAGKLSPGEWKAILEKHNHACYYCHKTGLKLEQEHKTPLTKGGKHNIENVVPACRECNARKFTKTEEEFLRSGILR